jgi:hypothetical protein
MFLSKYDIYTFILYIASCLVGIEVITLAQTERVQSVKLFQETSDESEQVQ